MPPTGVAAGVLGALSFGAGDFAGAVRRPPRGSARRGRRRPRRRPRRAAGRRAHRPAAAPRRDGLALGSRPASPGSVGLAALYRGMSLGSMGIVTSLAGAGSLAIPLVVGALLGASRRRRSSSSESRVPPQPRLPPAAPPATTSAGGRSAWPELAALGFGTWYVLVDARRRRRRPAVGARLQPRRLGRPDGRGRIRVRTLRALALSDEDRRRGRAVRRRRQRLLRAGAGPDPDRPGGRAHRPLPDRDDDPRAHRCSGSGCRGSARSASPSPCSGSS